MAARTGGQPLGESVERPDWVPEGVDVTVPNAARMYDYALGGYHNFAVDREYVERLERIMPGSMLAGHSSRAFLGRAVRWLADAGITQFLDIGSGIPTLGNVHEIVQASTPGARVLYVDIDPVAVAHSRAILIGEPRVDVIQADLRDTAGILNHPTTARLLDFSEPVAVVLSAVLHFIPDTDDPAGILARLVDELVAGSYLVISHGSRIPGFEAKAEEVQEVYQRTPTPLIPRNSEQLTRLFTGLDRMEIVEPGVVPIGEWRPDPLGGEPAPWFAMIAGVAMKL